MGGERRTENEDDERGKSDLEKIFSCFPFSVPHASCHAHVHVANLTQLHTLLSFHQQQTSSFTTHLSTRGRAEDRGAIVRFIRTVRYYDQINSATSHRARLPSAS